MWFWDSISEPEITIWGTLLVLLECLRGSQCSVGVGGGVLLAWSAVYQKLEMGLLKSYHHQNHQYAQ